MTSPQEAAGSGRSSEELRAELDWVDAERDQILRQVQDLRAELSDAGPMDAEDRTSVITQADELKSLAAELERRRDALLEKLEKSS
jgi:uncharacterized coiled-coil DUF342 family protein